MICKIFGHKFGPVERRLDIYSCESYQVCYRCHFQKTWSVNLHGDLPWKESGTPCVYIRQCPRCDQVIRQEERHLSTWEYLKDRSCKQVERCSRCGKILGNRIEHNFQLAEELMKQPCHVIEKCQRCAEKRNSIQHNMVFVKRLHESATKDFISYTDLMKCSKCGLEETVSDEHYTDW